MRWLLALAFLTVTLLNVGCTDWKKRYDDCSAELEELQAQYDASQAALADCNAQLRDQDSRPQAAPAAEPVFSGEESKWDPAKGTLTVAVATDVLFDSGKITLKSAAKSRLANIVKVLKTEYAGKEVSIVGHTDTDPIRKSKWQDNWELSCQRALAVTRYLVSQGVNAKQLIASGRGEFHSAGSKSASRRVEIVVHMY